MSKIKAKFIVKFLAVIAVILMLSLSTATHALDHDNDTNLKFTWTDAFGDVDHYKIYVNAYVSTDQDEYILKDTTAETLYTVTGEDGYTYRVKVQAADPGGQVGPMSEASEPVVCDTSPPPASSDLSLTVLDNNILLEWTASADAASYNVYRDTESDFTPDQTGGSNRIATDVTDENAAATGIQWTDTGDGVILIGDTNANYFYLVTAVDAAGNESGASNKVGEFDIELVAGTENLISLPLQLSEPYTSYTFLEHLSSEIGIEISRFNALILIQDWESAFYDADYNLDGTDFPIIAGEGYCVQVLSDTVQTFTGDVITTPITLDLKRGDNLIGIPYSAEEYTSYTLILSIPECLRVMRYNVETLLWETACLDRNGDVAGDNFTITAGEGYYVYTLSDNSWTPDNTAAPRLIPRQNQLVQNYPNPFNPETWIPFQLSQASEVKLRIYNATGQLVKTIQLGYKPAGMYLNRSKAAYWDGRNDRGEQVASGVYFYELRTGTFKEIRKMMLLK